MDNLPIIAIATAHGSGGIGIIRISGQNLLPLIHKICHKNLIPRYATLLDIVDENKQSIDKVIALYFKAPNSYTGEDVLELQAHGGMVILELIIKRCLILGKEFNLRMAKAGEFTQRAFLNGKIDLLQAEAVIDIINAHSENAAKSASQSLQGHFSTAINNLLDKIIYLRLLIESSIDFPEEELDYSHMQNINQQFNSIIDILDTIQTKAKQGYILNKGINIVLVGAPNVGKSSLMNALAQKEVAIVTPIAGTTRDKISTDIQICGVNIHLIDTAGLRKTNDEIEEIGIKYTWQAIAQSQLVLYITSYNQQDNINQEHLLQEILTKNPTLQVIYIKNKLDLLEVDNIINNNFIDKQAILSNSKAYISISAKHNLGLDILQQEILHKIGYVNNSEGIFLARERHIQAIELTKQSIFLAYKNLQVGLHLDLIAEELRIAQQNLAQITGNFTSDDLLGKIFSEFCIGK